MSYTLVDKVFDLDLPRSEKQVLMSLARHASNEGRDAYPSVEPTIMLETGLSERGVQIALRRLEAKRLIEDSQPERKKKGGPKQTVNYTLLTANWIANPAVTAPFVGTKTPKSVRRTPHSLPANPAVTSANPEVTAPESVRNQSKESVHQSVQSKTDGVIDFDSSKPNTAGKNEEPEYTSQDFFQYFTHLSGKDAKAGKQQHESVNAFIRSRDQSAGSNFDFMSRGLGILLSPEQGHNWDAENDGIKYPAVFLVGKLEDGSFAALVTDELAAKKKKQAKHELSELAKATYGRGALFEWDERNICKLRDSGRQWDAKSIAQQLDLPVKNVASYLEKLATEQKPKTIIIERTLTDDIVDEIEKKNAADNEPIPLSADGEFQF
jgi:hypothetical protein